MTLITAHLLWSWQNLPAGRALLPKVQSVAGLGTLVFRDASSLCGTLQAANGTSVTVGNWIKTLHLGGFA